MLFADASTCITINGRQSSAFGLFRSIWQGCPLAPSLYVLTAERFGYLLANVASLQCVKGISLPNSQLQLLNGHFTDDSFLTLLEEEETIHEALQCLNIFYLVSGSAIQWHKTLCYRQSVLPCPAWLQPFSWKWIGPGETFRFLGIPFAFQASPMELWQVVLARVEKKLAYWITKPLSLAGKFQICSKVLAATHVYYSSCWAPSKAAYSKLEKLLQDFLWASSDTHHGFHRVAWDFCCLPRDSGGLGLLSTQRQGIALCVKWVIHSLMGDEAWKILLRHCIQSSFPINRPAWKGIGLQTLLVMKEPVQIVGTFVAKSIWCAWESVKPWLWWSGSSFRDELSLN
ncbi:uncharacterized protein LOC131856688 [Cryptomeria japonica]|uniref:uncharacterized protein LOC131856688 n=1 Tax=Cryptomeria japonica TaxID=3369 RepID=UPI0027D9CEDA|nr:uncharacterized protein LOC131856688 [Cryptomeria japonica]